MTLLFVFLTSYALSRLLVITIQERRRSRLRTRFIGDSLREQ